MGPACMTVISTHLLTGRWWKDSRLCRISTAQATNTGSSSCVVWWRWCVCAAVLCLCRGIVCVCVWWRWCVPRYCVWWRYAVRWCFERKLIGGVGWDLVKMYFNLIYFAVRFRYSLIRIHWSYLGTTILIHRYFVCDDFILYVYPGLDVGMNSRNVALCKI